MMNQVTQIARAPAESDNELFFDERLSPISGMDLKEIRQLTRFLPVIVLIPRPVATDRLASHKVSPAKPSTERSEANKLLGVLEKAVEQFKGSGGSTVAFGDVTVNFSTMEAFRKSEQVALTTKEFQTLRYFIQHAGRVISREELLNEVWGYENYPCTRTVDNRVLKLRQKFERNLSRPLHFRTIHGAGYKFLP
jgi:DNA-binding response OmpR family regulator